MCAQLALTPASTLQQDREVKLHLLVLQAFPRVPACPATLNPATWMLEISSPHQELLLGNDFAQLYLQSELCK
jgi:hypothetical protein